MFRGCSAVLAQLACAIYCQCDTSLRAVCIFINACSSSELAKRLCQEPGVPHAIGWSTKVNDEAALNFAEAFYNHLSLARCQNQDFEGAFEAAKEELEYRNWTLRDPDDEVAFSQGQDDSDSDSDCDSDDGKGQAAGIPCFHSREGLKDRDNESDEKESSVQYWNQDGLIEKK